jgi:hypothetical protein
VEQQWAALDAERRTLADDRATIEAEREALLQQRRQWDARPQTPDGQPPMDREMPDAEPADDAAIDAEAPAATATEDVEFSAPAPQAPVDLSDILRRLGAKVDFSDDRPAGGEPPSSLPSKPVPPPDESRAAPAAARAVAGKEEGEEESIDEYMSRLMGRIRAGSGAAEASSAQRAPEAPRPPRPAPAVWSAESAGQAAPVPAAPGSPMPQEHRRESVTVVPRTTAPETHSGLSVLRELANYSAQNAISHHARRVLIGQMYSKLMVIVVALGAAGWLLWAWKSLMTWEATFYSALVALLAAIYWGVQYSLLTGRLIVNQAGWVKLNTAHAKAAEGDDQKCASGRSDDGATVNHAPTAESAEPTATAAENATAEALQNVAAATEDFDRIPANVEGLLASDARTLRDVKQDGSDGSPR